MDQARGGNETNQIQANRVPLRHHFGIERSLGIYRSGLHAWMQAGLCLHMNIRLLSGHILGDGMAASGAMEPERC